MSEGAVPAAAFWPEVADLAIERHRLAASIPADAMAEAPPEVAERLREAGVEAGRSALLQKAETRRIFRRMSEAGCRPVLAKGWAMAERLYGSAGVRHAKDLDLHVAEAEVPAAIRVLDRLGYTAVHAARRELALEQHDAVFRETNDIAFLHPSGLMVEIHWRLTHLDGWITLDEIPDAIATHPLDRSGDEVAILSDRAAVIYLSVHGQLHMWGRLKWLLDVAKLFERRGDALSEDCAIAETLNAGRAVRIAADLASRVFATPLPSDWPEPSGAERLATAFFLNRIQAASGEPGTWHSRLGYHACVMALGETWRQRFAAPRYAILRNLRIGLAAKVRR